MFTQLRAAVAAPSMLSRTIGNPRFAIHLTTAQHWHPLRPNAYPSMARFLSVAVDLAEDDVITIEDSPSVDIPMDAKGYQPNSKSFAALTPEDRGLFWGIDVS
jgi:hypothetical protein